MNKHFEDTQYYLRRAVETASKGLKEEVESVRERFQSVVGGDGEPEPSRVESIREDLTSLQGRAEGEAREALGNARERLEAYRGEQRQERAAE